MSSKDFSSGNGFTHHVSKVKVVFLGSRNAGKSSAVNTILGREEFDLKRTAQCVVIQGDVAGRKITAVEAPGWQRNKSIRNSTELLKQEIVLSVSRCPPGPHAVLLVLRLNVKSWKSEQNVLEGYLKLLTERVWSHTIVLFTFGDALGDTTIEQYIKTEEYLQGLVEKCGNRYHVFNNTKRDDVSQVTELLEKIEKMVAGNGGCHLEMDKKILQDVEERRREEEKRSKERVMKVSKKKEYIRSHMKMRLVLLGYKNAGKSSSGSTILRDDTFRDRKNKCTDGEVAGRKITIVEAPGWQRNTPVCRSTEQYKQEMVSSMSVCPPGPHAVLLVMCLDLKFRRKQRNVLEGYLSLLGDNVWSHTIVLFTFGDFLGDTTIEQYIEREGEDLQWLVERCANRYHVFNNTKRDDDSQVTQLLEKIEEMVAGNGSCHLEIDFKSKSELNMEDSGAGSNTPPVPRPANMGQRIPSIPHTTIPQNKPGNVSDFEDQGPRITQKQRDKKGTEDERMKMEKPVLLTLPRADRPSSAVEVFTPELECAEDQTKYEYSFLCPHAGQFMCKVTKLIFEMEGEGEVLYSIVSWDRCPLDGLGQKEPAGPLYSINCYEDSIRKLHLPHCETRKDDVKLTVVHVTGGNVEIIQPLQVTDTHVIIDVQDFSLFGLLRNLIFKNPIESYPIEAQVLLFYKNLKGKHRKSKLHMHLLPGNVPIEEVKKQECQPYIATSATCDVTPDKEYRPFSKNTHHKITIQPEVKKFKSNYGPNYHPTFEVIFNTDVDEVTLGLLDENKEEVWSRLVLLTDTEAASSKSDTTGADFMKKHREMLIQRVPSVMEIADRLIGKNMISDEMYSKINVSSLTSQQQMRILYSVIGADKTAADVVYEFLKEKMPGLVDDLESGSSS